jgi:predicted lysophospholipase L1 biosynthesis ABC-type transport system permease subunit
MVVLGGTSGVVISVLVHPGIAVALLGFAVGVVLGVFADRWTQFVKYL